MALVEDAATTANMNFNRGVHRAVLSIFIPSYEESTASYARTCSVERFAPVFVCHCSNDRRGDHDCGNPRGQDAIALRRPVTFRLDSADCGDVGGAGGGLLRGRPAGGSFAAVGAALLGHPRGSGLSGGNGGHL